MLRSATNTNVEDFRQAAVVSSRLTRMARECVDEWPPQVLMPGGSINGTAVGSMTPIARSLPEGRPLRGDEERTAAVNQLMTPHRHHDERIDDLFSRFGIPRSRAQQAGQLTISYECLGYLQTRARGLADSELSMTL